MSKRLKATSLIEVLIVLAVISFAIISSVELVARANLIVKTNEIEDQANSLMLKALETFKSSSPVLLSQDVLTNATGGTYYFATREDTTGSYLLYDASGSSNSLQNCTSSNTYFVPNLSFSPCMQVAITPVNALSGKYYDITVNITYKVPNKTINDNLRTFRYYGFAQKP